MIFLAEFIVIHLLKRIRSARSWPYGVRPLLYSCFVSISATGKTCAHCRVVPRPENPGSRCRRISAENSVPMRSSAYAAHGHLDAVICARIRDNVHFGSLMMLL